MNKFFAIGRLTKEPELRYTTSGVAVTSFSIAVNRTFKNAEGEYEADFINCVAYKHQAETIAKYIKKGDRLGIEARIQTRSYENQEGKTIRLTEAIIEHMDFIESRKSEEKQQEEPELETDPFLEEQLTIEDNDLPW